MTDYTLNYGGSTIGALYGGTAIAVPETTIYTYSVAEDHQHDQQHWPPLEAVECLSVAPVAGSYAYIAGSLLFRRFWPQGP